MPKYKLVVFDLDGVFFEKPWQPGLEEIAVSTWDLVFKTLGIYDLHQKLARIFIKGGFKSYLEWTNVACCLLVARGLTKDVFDEIINSRKFTTGAKETVKILKDNEIITGIITGSFWKLANRAKEELGVDHILAHCRLVFDEETGLLKDWKLLATDWKDKIKFISYIADLHKIKLSECVFVGDDVNDIPALRRVGLSIVFNTSKQTVKDAAKVVVEGNDLRKILPYILEKSG